MEQFFCKTRILAGPGSLVSLSQLHIHRLLVVADPYFCKNGTADQIAHISKAAHTKIFSKVVPDPSAALAAEGTQIVQAFGPDTILALGGGSAMDCAKAMRFFSGSEAQFIAVPTTSGSGSEVTDFAILTHDGVKHPLVDAALQPDIAILDSELLTSLPPKLIAETGFDLICHAIEAWASTGSSAISDALAAEALRTAFAALPKSFAGDVSVRQALHQAATMAGMAFSSAGLGLCHAIAHALGGEFHKPHGALGAIVLPAVIEYNAPMAQKRYADLSRRLGLSAGADAVALRALKNALLRLRRELKLPENLHQLGIDGAMLTQKLDALVAAALADSCTKTNPVKPDAPQLRRILNEIAGHG